ncbi:cell wall-binding repeat-containing protein [Thermophilibacter immobilis]|uniref:Cell wall-binding repeat-containing protein n=1 Tax=Thermophilibacter immobilis TaxID=2779519 RepID=A0A7S7M9X4_9ACTN|nr:cell wall-binding repeat-containing protein [Thermophilibacter immobilis]QOY61391.1 cell wall-binding repeat-containing protein [Thermophilibacter immobilis]
MGILFSVLAFLCSFLWASPASADVIEDQYGTVIDRTDFFDMGVSDSAPSVMSLMSTRSVSSIEPMELSAEMLSHCKYESGQNYDQGLSYGDGYHALGYFQFDNRHTLGSFLEAVYNYNPTTYSCLKVIGDNYDWDVTGETRSNGAYTQLGNDLNTAWHAAYAANPTEFSQLQNYWAYVQYYSGSTGVRGSMIAMGIDIDSRPDCIKGLCWGLSSLFGPGGGASYVKQGYYYGGNWFIKNSGVNDSMSDVQFVTTLCNFVVDNVRARYHAQSQYWAGWENRYRNELADCLGFLSESSEVWTRLYGQDQLGTMEEISQAGFSRSSTVIIATQETYWDALSAASLAGAYDAPILLCSQDSLPQEAADEIARLGATTAYIVGGPVAVSSSVDSQIRAAGCPTVERVYGQDQQGTARAVAEKLSSARSSTCIIATSNGFQDALSSGPYSYVKGAPIFLAETSTNALSQETLKAISSGGYTRVIIAGGPVAVSSSVEAQLSSLGLTGSAVKRVYGQTGYETSAALAEFSLSEGMSASGMGVATGETYWDALTGSALCGRNNSVLVLASDANTSAIDGFISTHAASIGEGNVFGGNIAVSSSVWKKLILATS